MSVFQIWGLFTKDDVDREHPTVVSMFQKGQLMGDSQTTMLEHEQKFADEEGEDLVLLKEFRPAPDVWLTPEAEMEVARQIFNCYMDGWWQLTAEDRGRHDRSADEPEPVVTPADL